MTKIKIDFTKLLGYRLLPDDRASEDGKLGASGAAYGVKGGTYGTKGGTYGTKGAAVGAKKYK